MGVLALGQGTVPHDLSPRYRSDCFLAWSGEGALVWLDVSGRFWCGVVLGTPTHPGRAFAGVNIDGFPTCCSTR